MNIIKVNNKLYKYESYWKNSVSDKTLDYYNNPLPYPKQGTEWQNKELFLSKLHSTESYLNKNNRFQKYEKYNFKSCLLCGQENITTGVYTINRIRWENGLFHYIDKHNIKPSEKFIDAIFRYEINPRILSMRRSRKIKGKIVIKNSKKYIKISRNQLLIMDALMEHGGKKQYVDKKNKRLFRYSEHAGLLDFNNDRLERIIVYGNTTRVETNDNDIFFPGDIVDAVDYEYIFHTHPPTPKPGGRAGLGIIYEFPSISDIFHFLEHYNIGDTQGSMIIAPEGLYIIRKSIQDNKKIKIDIDKLYQVLKRKYNDIFKKSYGKYGEDFTTDKFYSLIAQDTSYIEEINDSLNKFDIHIDYYSRIKDKSGKWVIDTIYIPVYVVELENTKSV
ncbi:MAG: hypothetical protein Homavirus2_24 [Homavirus sp.]|uniref:Uncharacterized protein n=1 Tax=Homavirus sp. TaxID=2487769 RepID=A0A3G5A470_9VIRU|nr:MAG: hypothetical protein Homavirus2_24 [Homavirus sp.]